MGVWIETSPEVCLLTVKRSHPAWVCGLKLSRVKVSYVLFVTPCVGVWIETSKVMQLDSYKDVTPCVGVWIETS